MTNSNPSDSHALDARITFLEALVSALLSSASRNGFRNPRAELDLSAVGLGTVTQAQIHHQLRRNIPTPFPGGK